MSNDKQENYRYKTFYTTIKSLWLTVNHNKLNSLIKELAEKSVCLAIFVYLVGTLLSLYKTHTVDLPFSPLSIIQCTILTICSFVIVASFIVIEHCAVDLVWLRLIQKGQSRLEKIASYIMAVLLIIIISYITIAILSTILNNMLEAIVVFILYYVIGVVVFRIGKSKDSFVFRLVWLVLGCALFVTFLPMNLGGFRSRKVEYCVYESGQTCQVYDYYGTSEGFYQFIGENEEGEKYVILAPADSGYIRYKQEKSKLFGLIEL